MVYQEYFPALWHQCFILAPGSVCMAVKWTSFGVCVGPVHPKIPTQSLYRMLNSDANLSSDAYMYFPDLLQTSHPMHIAHTIPRPFVKFPSDRYTIPNYTYSTNKITTCDLLLSHSPRLSNTPSSLCHSRVPSSTSDYWRTISTMTRSRTGPPAVVAEAGRSNRLNSPHWSHSDRYSPTQTCSSSCRYGDVGVG